MNLSGADRAPNVDMSLAQPRAPANHAVPMTRASSVGWTWYLPTLLFLAFFLPNTRLRPLSQYMMLWRWAALFAILALTLFTVRRLGKWPGLWVLAAMSFGLLATTLPFSSNVPMSTAKWIVFFSFLVFCIIFYGRIRRRRGAELALSPMVKLFTVLIWVTPPTMLLFPQRHAYYFSGFFAYTNGLGQFMVLFGLPAALYLLETSSAGRNQNFRIATLGLALILVFASGSRTAGFATLLVLGIAFWRWKRPQGRLVLPAKALILLAAALVIPGQRERVQTFVYKYEGSTTILESRTHYWERTEESFRRRPWTGSGFGVQEQQAEAELSYASRGAFREQGSNYLGMLEEVGLLGSMPIFILFAAVGLRNLMMLLRSRDPLRLLLARSIVVGLLWGVSENYLLYLGNAASIIFFCSFFLQERLGQLERYERTSRQRVLTLRRQMHDAGLTSWRPAGA